MSRAVQDNASGDSALKAAIRELVAEPEGQVWDIADDEPESESDPGPGAEGSREEGAAPGLLPLPGLLQGSRCIRLLQ